MTQNTFQIESSAVSDRGLSEKRPENEDSYLEMPERGLFAVADGVGGAQAGDVASQMAMEILGEAFTNLHEGGDVEELMEIAISRANGAIFQMSNDLPQLATMATTIVALHIAGNIATIGHVGDSRLYRLDARGNLYRETQDHSVVEEEVRAGRMTREQAENHPSKNVISRALGAESTVEIDMKTIMFEPNTMFLICSDGVTRHVPDGEIRDLLASPNPPVQICGKIKEICYSRGAEDNLTAVIVRSVGNAVEHDADFEESTVATPRPPLVNSAIFANNVQEHDEIPTQNLQLPQEMYQAQNLQDNSQISIPAATAANDTASISSNTRTETITPASTYKREKNYEVVENTGSGLGKLLAGVLLGLIIGGIIGAAGVYAWLSSQAPKEIPKITQSQTPNIPYSAFEDNRRNVDKNPQQYINSSGATAQDAEDYYLLGRAYLLTGKYTEAKDAFNKAKTRLSQEVNDNNKAILTNEIALGLAAIENPFSIKILEAEKDKISSSKEANSNVSGNSAGNGNVQK